MLMRQRREREKQLVVIKSKLRKTQHQPPGRVENVKIAMQIPRESSTSESEMQSERWRNGGDGCEMERKEKPGVKKGTGNRVGER